ncbi:MAG: sigma-54 dependent transcriptional regulator [Reichenbachiella sp.]|uniref:sigma-54-dependent transcriptional regulator n=1 Tax=Reichenbachiella sp. TaxID=2184521 RepID=UPI0032679550
MEDRLRQKKGNILIVDDDAGILTSAQLFLKQYYSNVYVELNPEKIKTHIETKSIDIVLLDMNFQKGKNEGKDGFKYLAEILNIAPDILVIFMTAYGDIEMAVQALKQGAIDFVTKPWKNEKFLTTMETAIKLVESNKRFDELKNVSAYQSEKEAKEIEGFIGNSAEFTRVKQAMDKVSETDASVLLLGENGTGKGLAAKYIHQNSLRAGKPLITIDMGALSDNLIESELFGHEKGAFTDAHQQKIGRLELANRGTLFLDEIGNLSSASQAKLLSVLQSRTFNRLGSNKEIEIDIRLICATNMPIYDMIAEGQFRQDLLYRINTVEVRMPSLSERVQDIPLLLNHYLATIKTKYKKHNLYIADDQVDQLKRMLWPGNIREFQHAIERAVILAEGNELFATDFQNFKTEVTQPLQLGSLNLRDMEIQHIKRAMALHNGNITHAAKELGIDRLALHRRLEKYAL